MSCVIFIFISILLYSFIWSIKYKCVLKAFKFSRSHLAHIPFFKILFGSHTFIVNFLKAFNNMSCMWICFFPRRYLDAYHITWMHFWQNPSYLHCFSFFSLYSLEYFWFPCHECIWRDFWTWCIGWSQRSFVAWEAFAFL